MLDSILKKLHIKMKPERLLTYIFYTLSIAIALFSFLTILRFLIGDARIVASTPPFLYAIYFFFPVLAYSYFVNSGLAKGDTQRIGVFVATCALLGLVVGEMAIVWINNGVWWLLEKNPNYGIVYSKYPELFAPALKTLSVCIPFIFVFKVTDFFLVIYRDEDLPKAVAGFSGISAGTKEIDGAFTCETIICKSKSTALPVVVPEKKRYEATLVQGATGTGKTATVLLPMSALDLEKKYFFREYSKKLGYAMLKKGIAYMNGPYNNDYINKSFSMKYLKPKRGMEDHFNSEVKSIIQYTDNSSDEVVYRDIGITVIENDGKFISDFTGVAKNFDIPVLAVDPINVESTLSINPFAIPDPPKVASIIADVLKSMYEDQGGGAPGDPFFTQVTLDAFQNLAILLKEMYPILNDGEVASLEDMLELLYNFDKVEEMTEEMKKIPELEQKYKLLISYFERNFYKPSLNINGYEIPGTRGSGRKDTERFLYGAITQLNNLLRHPGLKKALCGKTNLLDFDKALQNANVITACSRKGELGIIQSKAFGMFFILQFQDAVLRRKGNEDSRVPHFLYIDEFPEYVNKDMEVMFTLFRKYRCGVTIAIQNLSQLEKSSAKMGTYYKQTILANTKTQIVFGDTIPEDSEYWAKAFGSDKVPDVKDRYDASQYDIKKSTSIEVTEKIRIKWYKIQNLGFGSVFYKTKDASGKTVFGTGKTSFLDSKYKQEYPSSMFNFEKYMMSKPDMPTINLNDSDDTSNDDDILGTSTTSKLMDELRSSNDTIITSPITEERYANGDFSNTNSLDNDFEIDLDEDEEPAAENAEIDGGAITEDYETPVIKRKKK